MVSSLVTGRFEPPVTVIMLSPGVSGHSDHAVTRGVRSQ